MAEHRADEPVQQPARKLVLELELDLASALPKPAKEPAAIELAERPLDEPDPHLRRLALGIFRGEAAPDAAIVDLDRRACLGRVAVNQRGAAAPREEPGVILHRINQGEHLLRREFDEHRLLDLRHRRRPPSMAGPAEGSGEGRLLK